MKINGTPDGGGKSAVIEGLTITSNGTYTAGAGVDGYSPVEVDVPAPEFVTETLSVSANGTYTPSEGIDGYSQVNVNVPATQFITETLSVSANGTYTPSEGVDGYSQVNVNVPIPQFVTEPLNVSANGTYTPSEGIDGYSQVVVDVPQSVTGYTEKDVTENNFGLTNLNNSASFVYSGVFSENNQLQTVNLPNCITVNNWAFAYCRNLTSVNLPICTTFSGNNQFYFNESLSQIYVPLLKNVPNNAFGECYNLKSIDLPEATYIGSSAFFKCSSLSQINIPKVSVISQYAFSGCNSLKSIYAPECISFSGGLQFNMCTELETVDFPILYSMSDYTFNSCNKLVSVSMPLLININNYTFRYCSTLSELNLPLLLSFFSDNNFTDCSSLEKISLPLCYNFGYYSQYRNQFYNCSSLKEVTIGTGLYMVPQYVSLGSYFIANNGVINIDAEMYDKWLSASGWSSMSAHFRSYVSTNSDPLLSVSDGVLYGRTKALIQGQASVDWKTYVSDVSTIVNVSLPECEVMNNCFEYISSLKTIYLPKVKLIPNLMSFRNYTITSIYFGELEAMNTIQNLPASCSVTIATSKVCKCLSTAAFYDNVPSIYVPASLVDAYKSAPAWSNISSNIFPIPE